MKTTSVLWRAVASNLGIVSLLFFPGCVLAVDLVLPASAAVASSAVAGASEPAIVVVPAVNHPKLVLRDGRMFVAGGMASTDEHSDREVGADSVVWDPKSGSWQVLGSDLSFGPNQMVFLNQLNDESVLMFVVSEQDDNDKPEYWARLWNPQSAKVEKLSVSTKAKLNTDIAVLRDGRVLIVNGIEGSADIWDSRTNTVVHNEVAQLENSRWRTLPLKNNRVLLVETFPDEHEIPVRKSGQSVTMLFDPASDEWKQLADLPVIFRKNSSLVEMDDGIAHAEVAGKAYQLPVLGADWEKATLIVRSSSKGQDNLASSSVQYSASLAVPVIPVAEVDSSIQRHSYIQTLDESKWILLAVLFPFVLYFILRQLESAKLELLLSYSGKVFSWFPRIMLISLIIFSILSLLYSYARDQLTAISAACMDEMPIHNGVRRTALIEFQQWATCVENRNGIFEDILFHSTKSKVMSLPSVPCRYVGIWTYEQGGTRLKLTLTDDSQFYISNDASVIDSGSWGVVDGDMVLIHDIQPLSWRYTADAYHIKPESRSRVMLVDDERGTTTVYDLVDAIKSNTCVF